MSEREWRAILEAIKSLMEGSERLRAELAEALRVRDEDALKKAKHQARIVELNADNAAKDARIAEVVAAFDGMSALCTTLRGELADAKARIGELEINEAWTLIAELKSQLTEARDRADDQDARAERAEAERDVMREALEPFAKLVDKIVDGGNKYTLVQVSWLRKARAALNPSPAGNTPRQPRAE